jgi:hypothetical protein
VSEKIPIVGTIYAFWDNRIAIRSYCFKAEVEGIVATLYAQGWRVIHIRPHRVKKLKSKPEEYRGTN